MPQPSRFGPYELLRRLGAGGMAETFEAIRRGPADFEQRVCLKRILPAYDQDGEFVRLFLDEARIAAKLRHANIVQVLDFGLAENSHFLALELIEGLDLRGLLSALAKRRETMTSGLVAYLATELATALDFAHSACIDGRPNSGKAVGVVHRDISPSNVLLSVAGEVKLTDFGIAKAMSRPQVTRSGVVKGKVPYMAPEYALSARYDARSDIFALGITLYEALAGRRPFDGVTDLDTLQRVKEGLHTPLSEIVPTAPAALVEAIERLIRPDPETRFGSAADFLDALNDVAPPPTARRILGELVRGAVDHARSDAPVASTASLVYGDTALGGAHGTLLVTSSGPPGPALEVAVSSPDAETRTRHLPNQRIEGTRTLQEVDATPAALPLLTGEGITPGDAEPTAKEPRSRKTTVPSRRSRKTTVQARPVAVRPKRDPRPSTAGDAVAGQALAAPNPASAPPMPTWSHVADGPLHTAPTAPLHASALDVAAAKRPGRLAQLADEQTLQLRRRASATKKWLAATMAMCTLAAVATWFVLFDAGDDGGDAAATESVATEVARPASVAGRQQDSTVAADDRVARPRDLATTSAADQAAAEPGRNPDPAAPTDRQDRAATLAAGAVPTGTAIEDEGDDRSPDSRPIRGTPPEANLNRDAEGIDGEAMDGDAVDREDDSEAPSDRRTSRAVLTVVVVPFGVIYVDGRRAGPSPAVVRLRPGEHVITSGEGPTQKRQVVRLRSGQRRQVVLR